MLKFLFTRKAKQEHEEVLHVGEEGTLLAFEANPGTAEALAELRRLHGQAAVATELSPSEFEQAKAVAEKEQKAFEAALPKISFEP
jgi:hypothetical protein